MPALGGRLRKIAEHLNGKGYRVDFYHGAREESERTRVQDAFFDDTAAGYRNRGCD